MNEKIIQFYNFVKGLPVFGKVISIVIVVLVSVLLLFSCSTSRNISLTVDKAESVNFSVRDSSNVELPL